MCAVYKRPDIVIDEPGLEESKSSDEAEIYINHGCILTNNMSDEEMLQEFEEDHGYKARSIQEARAHNAQLAIGHLMNSKIYGNWK